MKLLIITLTITFLIVGIENNNLLSTKNSLIEEKKESYHACIRLKLKAPNLNNIIVSSKIFKSSLQQ